MKVTYKSKSRCELTDLHVLEIRLVNEQTARIKSIEFERLAFIERETRSSITFNVMILAPGKCELTIQKADFIHSYE